VVNPWLRSIQQYILLTLVAKATNIIKMLPKQMFSYYTTGIFTVFVFFSISVYSQNVIGGSSGDPTAILDLQSTEKGLIIPRMSTEQRTAINNPASGLMIFNTSLQCLELNVGSPEQPFWSCLMITKPLKSIACSGVVTNDQLFVGRYTNRVTFTIPYEGGNGLPYSSQSFTAEGVTGLVATLSPGIFEPQDGRLHFTIIGTPSEQGTASFQITVGGQTCVINVVVETPPANVCGAYVAEGLWKQFMCHNLGANTSADPFEPSWELNGDYYQWGRVDVAAAGPSGPMATQANAGAIIGWINTYSSNGAWSDLTKTVNDPCPSGFRLPTITQWQGVLNNPLNTKTDIGTNWTESATNYSTGFLFGNALYLPAAGYRNNSNGILYNRGFNGNYWSSSQNSSNSAGYLYFNNTIDTTFNTALIDGISLRCIAE
jgi:uncharacterized protein (TIGR02145 family)